VKARSGTLPSGRQEPLTEAAFYGWLGRLWLLDQQQQAQKTADHEGEPQQCDSQENE
jgi:hypothetical protein